MSLENTHNHMLKGGVCVWFCWGFLVCQEPFNDFLLVVATLQSHVEASFCKVLSSCRTVGGSGKRMIEREDGKIGHSCSLSFPNAPSPLQALQPTLSESTFSAIPPPQHTHTHTTWCLLSPRPHVSYVYFLDARGERRKKRNFPHSTGHMLVRGGGKEGGGGGRTALNVHQCSTVCSAGKQCHHVV